jgi:SAM-dependent methyltransferase
MHPATAASIVGSLSRKGDWVLDPFCGSGTVLVEALLAGRASAGRDLNPLAVALARTKLRVRAPNEHGLLLDEARGVHGLATERRKQRAGALRRYEAEDVELFEPHVLLELDSLRAGILRVAHPQVRDDLFLVLSAIVVKVSRKVGDTSDRQAPRRLAAGYTAKLFLKKAEELEHRLRAFERLLRKPRPPCEVALDDARLLRSVSPASVDLVLTSPPYAATYDYFAHHALRMRWLGLDGRGLRRHELGARRDYAALQPEDAEVRWRSELDAVLHACGRVLRPRGQVVLLMADSAVGTRALRADEMVAAVAEQSGFTPVAAASQVRPHFHDDTARAFSRSPRREHLLLLESRGATGPRVGRATREARVSRAASTTRSTRKMPPVRKPT